MKTCECGCGAAIDDTTTTGKPRRFLHGHHNRLRWVENRVSVTHATVGGTVAVIPLTQGKYAMVDVGDLPLVQGTNWSACRKGRDTWYAVRGSGKTREKMHRIIARKIDAPEVDHEDGNGLNNRRRNLRPCTHHQNSFNRRAKPAKSGFRGVVAAGDKWVATLTLNAKSVYLGLHDTPELAAKAYDDGARRHFGEFARTNF